MQQRMPQHTPAHNPGVPLHVLAATLDVCVLLPRCHAGVAGRAAHCCRRGAAAGCAGRGPGGAALLPARLPGGALRQQACGAGRAVCTASRHYSACQVGCGGGRGVCWGLLRRGRWRWLLAAREAVHAACGGLCFALFGLHALRQFWPAAQGSRACFVRHSCGMLCTLLLLVGHVRALRTLCTGVLMLGAQYSTVW